MAKFEKKYIPEIKELIEYATLFLEGKISDRELIDNMEDICSILYDYEDRYLFGFKGLWSQITDIEDEIKQGISSQKDIDDFINSHDLKKWCVVLINKYIAILKELENEDLDK